MHLSFDSMAQTELLVLRPKCSLTIFNILISFRSIVCFSSLKKLMKSSEKSRSP